MLVRCLLVFLVGVGFCGVSFANESAREHFHQTIREIQVRSAHVTGRDLVLDVVRDRHQHLSLRRYAAYSFFEQAVTRLMSPSDSISFARYLIQESDDPVIAYFGQLILAFHGVSNLDVYPESIGLHQEWNRTFGVNHGAAEVWQSFAAQMGKHSPVWAQSLGQFVMDSLGCSGQFF